MMNNNIDMKLCEVIYHCWSQGSDMKWYFFLKLYVSIINDPYPSFMQVIEKYLWK